MQPLMHCQKREEIWPWTVMDVHVYVFLKIKKTWVSNVVRATRFWKKKTFIRYAQNRKIGRSNNFKVFRNNKTKGPKQGHKNRLRSPMSQGEEPLLTC